MAEAYPGAEGLVADSQQLQVSRWLWWKRFRAHRAGLLALVVLLGIGAFAAIGPLVWQQDYAAADLSSIAAGPTLAHPLGTDALGRDILIRLMVGARVSLIVGVVSQLIAITLATAVGLAAGYGPALADGVLMRIVDVALAIPDLLLMILLVPLLTGVLGPNTAPQGLVDLNTATFGTFGLVVAISAITWMTVARVIRGQVLALRERPFVEATVTLGATRFRVIWRHLIPNLATILAVSITLGIPRAVLLEAGISFLGLGVNPPLPSWGTMISDALGAMQSNPHILLAPAAALSITVLSLNLFGDAVRDAIDPRAIS